MYAIDEESHIINDIATKHFPAKKLRSFTVINGGVFNKSYLLIFYDGLRLVLRISPPQEFLVGYEHNLMHAEKIAYDLFRKEGLFVPRVLLVDNSFDIINRIYMVSEYIFGMSLYGAEIPSNELAECHQDAGRALRKIHSIKGTRFGRVARIIENGGFDTWAEAIIDEVNTWLDVFLRLQIMSKQMIYAVKTVYEMHTSTLNAIITPYLLHGDLWDGNILVSCKGNQYKFQAIIDADHVMFGDPEMDFFSGKMPSSAFSDGYENNISSSWNAFIRRRLYLLLFSIRQCYVYKYILGNPNKSNDMEKQVCKFLHEFGMKL